MTDETGGLFKPDFFDRITNVNFGSKLWLGITMGVSFVGPPAPSIACNFPTQAGGTPGFAGFVGGAPQRGPDPTVIQKNHPRTHTNAGSGFIGYNCGSFALMEIGTGLCVPNDRAFTVQFSGFAPEDAFGDESGASAQVSLIDVSNVVTGAGVFITAEGNFVKKQLAQATNHFFTSIAGPLIFNVDPVKKTVTTSGGQGH